MHVSWYPLAYKKIRKKIQVTQNKCISFCLKLKSGHHIGVKEFKEINRLPTKEKEEQCVTKNVFKYWKGLHHSMKIICLLPPEIHIKQDFICFWRYLLEKLT